MESLTRRLTEYRLYHTHRINKILHYIGAPLIVLALLVALSWISLSVAMRWHISFAWIAVIALLIYYYFLDIKLTLLMAVIMILVTLLCTWIAFPMPTEGSLFFFLVLLIGGGALLFIGHTFETSKVDFSTYMKSIFIGPLYLVAELLLALNLGKQFGLQEHQPPTPPSPKPPPTSKTPSSL
ncbi:Mpo1 family 2-hydroxy fatty acid dioxygenase [Coxiella endosymbiont of Ornithodoros maritimus]|uniref:Mpo1 family 2-hydroxy fatty acid dioxygenase n=1 Tax=Coxiella endosymbiont of Ornithodoros maritimus TaxID=1656172 RepID=UPI00226537EF|nr:Mpo1-like protein [Coxiella endosymbiont of Ornithodoros maritimus]